MSENSSFSSYSFYTDSSSPLSPSLPSYPSSPSSPLHLTVIFFRILFSLIIIIIIASHLILLPLFRRFPPHHHLFQRFPLLYHLFRRLPLHLHIYRSFIFPVKTPYQLSFTHLYLNLLNMKPIIPNFLLNPSSPKITTRPTLCLSLQENEIMKNPNIKMNSPIKR